jgi:hypothetical protein
MNVILSPTEQLLAESSARSASSAVDTINYDSYLAIKQEELVFSRYPKLSYVDVVRNLPELSIAYEDLQSPISMAGADNLKDAYGTSSEVETTRIATTMPSRDAVGMIIANAFHAYPIKDAAVVDLLKATESELELRRADDNLYAFYQRTTPGERLVVIDASESLDSNDAAVQERTRRLIANNSIKKIISVTFGAEKNENTNQVQHSGRTPLAVKGLKLSSRPRIGTNLQSIKSLPGNPFLAS